MLFLNLFQHHFLFAVVRIFPDRIVNDDVNFSIKKGMVIKIPPLSQETTTIVSLLFFQILFENEQPGGWPGAALLVGFLQEKDVVKFLFFFPLLKYFGEKRGSSGWPVGFGRVKVI